MIAARATAPLRHLSGFARDRLVLSVLAVTILLCARLAGPFVEQGPVICPLHGVIGLPCPACGLTRALCRLAQLDVLEALRLNALSVPFVAALLVLPGVAAYEIARHRRCAVHEVLYSPRCAAVLGCVVTLYHLGRVMVGLYDGSLVRDYVLTSWTASALRALGVLAG